MTQPSYQIPKELASRKSFVKVDNIKIADNIRLWCAKKRNGGFKISYRQIAKECNIHPNTFSRILRGYGTSEECLIAIAKSLGVLPGKLLLGVNDWSRFPNVKPVRGLSRSAKRSLSFSRVDELFLSNNNISRFFGGAEEEDILWARMQLWKIREYMRKKRERNIESEYAH